MNKLLMLGVAAVSMAVAVPAMAEPHEGGKKDMFTLHDTNKDGSVSKEEFLAGSEKKFAELDTDKNGSISKAEHDARKAEWKEKMKDKRAKAKERFEKGEPAPTPAE